MSKYLKVKQHKRSLHKDCMRKGCGYSATVTAVHKAGAMVLDVWYCENHARQGGLVE